MKKLDSVLTRRNRVFDGVMPAINISLNLQMPEVKEKMVAQQREPKKDDRKFAEVLAEKLREKPLYTKNISSHPGGG